MEKMNDLKDLLKHEIEDLYSVEEQILEALPKMIDKANNTSLKNALSDHYRVTEQHKSRLEKIQQTLNKGSEEKKKGFIANLFSGKYTCKGMQGILEEGNKILNADISPEALDAAIIAAAQKVEHYEICGYGTARTFARELGMEQIARQLEQTLNEEYAADDLLTQLAVQRINEKAESAKNDSSSASSRVRSAGRVKERASREMEMEPVNSTRGRSTARSSSGTESGRKPANEKEGHPKTAGASRSQSINGGRTSSHSRSTKSTGRTGGSSGRSSSGKSGRGR